MASAGTSTPSAHKAQDSAPYVGPYLSVDIAGARQRLRRIRDWFDQPSAPYYVLLACTVILVVFGLAMVLSSSNVIADRENNSPYFYFTRQLQFATMGAVAAAVAWSLPTKFTRVVAWPVFIVVLLIMFAVPFVGRSVNGNTNWIVLGGFQFQPSEAGKLAFSVWAGSVLFSKRKLLNRYQHLYLPVLPVAILMIGLVLAGGDLGTALILMAISAAILLVAGIPWLYFLGALTAAALLSFALIVQRESRLGRFACWLSDNPSTVDCLQFVRGQGALATGGLWGVGLGQGRQKWSWLPEAHNDFIFAIIGEELGLLGAMLVIALFGLLAWAMWQVIRRSDDLFVQITVTGIMTWVIGQSIINMGSVTGLLPIVGLPLPLVSYGGSALMTTMAALGMVTGFARSQRQAATGTPARNPVLRRSWEVWAREKKGRR